ncbi:MAG TPA: glycogen debranching enzyme GlgX, partial [Burkholderiaceae bacterium]|nr:glycogen debranching enzyme GlgX [Burkholderiaceae bacterium]
PILSLRGIDNRSYYHLRPGHLRFYENYTGTGNALKLQHPRALQLVLDSMRYWVDVMHVDGFRFDLAPVLGRGDTGFESNAAFFACVRQDPTLARVKLIAEPWDAGVGGHQTGNFPPGWSEWNDRYRDAVRSFWISKAAYRGELASRLAGSSDVFGRDGRSPQASVNYVTSHDGFTLHDLVSYDVKHNEDNGEGNRDGSDANYSWNCGVEGETALLAVNALRARLKRALLATLMLSQGVPMLLGGDELGRTQRGNNNAYCHDSELSWFDWDRADAELIEYTAQLIALRRRYRSLRRRRWLTGETSADGIRDVVWLNRRGVEMNRRQWEEWGRYVLGMLLGPSQPGENALLVLINAEGADWRYPLPAGKWQLRLDTAHPGGAAPATVASGELLIEARSLKLLEALPGGAA